MGERPNHEVCPPATNLVINRTDSYSSDDPLSSRTHTSEGAELTDLPDAVTICRPRNPLERATVLVIGVRNVRVHSQGPPGVEALDAAPAVGQGRGAGPVRKGLGDDGAKGGQKTGCSLT